MYRYLRASEQLTPEQRGHALLTGIGMTLGGMIAYAGGNIAGLRHIANIPYDLNPFEHLGNVWPTMPFALAAPMIAASLERRTAAENVTTLRRIAVAGALGLALGGGINATTETTFGNDHIGVHLPLIDASSVPTGSDMVWGTATCVGVAAGFAGWRDRKITQNASAFASTETSSGAPPTAANVDASLIATFDVLNNTQLDAMQLLPVIR